MRHLLWLLVLLPSLAFGQVPPQVSGPGPGPIPGVPASGTFTPLPGPFSLGNTSGVFNVGAPQLNHWRAAMARVRAGLGRGKIVIEGDSTVVGAGSGTGGTNNMNDAFATAWPQALSTLLGSQITVSDNSLFGTQGTTVAYGTYDTRAVLGAGWAPNVGTLGGAFFRCAASSATTLSFTPQGQIDTIIIWYLQQNANGSFTVDVDGGASLGTVSANGTSLVKSVTFTVAKGSHTINLNSTGGAIFFISGIIAYDSTAPAIDVIQTGQFGAKALDFTVTGQAYSPQTVLAALAPDLTIIDLTINDSNAGTALSTYTTQIQTMITAAQLSGDVILMVGPPSNTTNATNGTLDQYISALRSLAISNNVGLIDIKQRWTSYAVTNPLMPYFDTLHPEAGGYKDIGLAVARALQP